MSNEVEARKMMDGMVARKELTWATLTQMAGWLADEAGGEWDVEKAKEDFLLPAFTYMLDGYSPDEARKLALLPLIAAKVEADTGRSTREAEKAFKRRLESRGVGSRTRDFYGKRVDKARENDRQPVRRDWHGRRIRE